MNTLEYILLEHQWGHDFLEMVMADATPELLHWHPPQLANPLGVTYAHAILGEDGVIAMLKGQAPLFAGDWAERTGLQPPQMGIDYDWARRQTIDLEALKAYAAAVRQATRDYLAGLEEADLEEIKDLSAGGMGQRTIGWCLAALVISHLSTMIGEISVLKGIQGAKGYPF